jgi:putative DNA primase/helicase
LHETTDKVYPADQSVIDQFMGAMREYGIDIDESIIADGKLHRYHVVGDKGRSRNGWAVLHIDEYPAGKFGCNKRFPGEQISWKMEGTRALTPNERRDLQEVAKARAAQRQAEREMNQANAAKRALDIYQDAQPVTEQHPYLALKGVPSSPRLRVGRWYYIDEDTGEEIVVSENALLAPMTDPTLTIYSLQAIYPDAREPSGFRKMYLKHGVKEGKFLSIGKPRDNTILISEGLATGLSLWQCTAHAVLVAYDAGNLIHVAKEARRVFPEHTILLCADNDAWTDAPIKNPGVTYASQAASAINGLVVFPEFLNTETKPSDFNDLHQLEGEQPVRDFIERALVPPAEPAAEAPLHSALIDDEQDPIEADEPTPGDGDTLTDTDIANSKRLAARHGCDMRFTAERGWLTYDGRRWRVDEKGVRIQGFAKATALSLYDEIQGSFHQKAAFTHARRSQSRAAIDNMVKLARDETGIPVGLNDFDADPSLLNVANGTIHLKTGQLHTHRREDLITNIVDIPFDPNAECELWDAFLWRITDHNDELYAYLRRLTGYLLAGDTTDQSLHFLYGSGANGKSVFCEILMKLLGGYAVVVSPELIMAKHHGGIPNDIARLRGVRAALMNETKQGSKFDEAKLKDLTGGDTLTGRFLHQEFFDFSPTHKLIIRGNHKPAIQGTDDGIWRRLRLIPFSVHIPLAEQDKNLLGKLTQELPGILQWALRGHREWREDGLKPPTIVMDAVREYRSESDTLGQFIDEHCVLRSLAQVKSSFFFENYQSFCQKSGERWISHKELPNEMRKRGLIAKRTKAYSVFEGIEFRGNPGDD